MADETKCGLPTWLVVLIALLAPVVIAVAFLTVFDWANQTIDPLQWQSDPGIGQRASDRNNALIFMHAIAQFGFLVVGWLFIKPRSGSRVLFPLIAAHVSAFVFLISLLGLLAG